MVCWYDVMVICFEGMRSSDWYLSSSLHFTCRWHFEAEKLNKVKCWNCICLQILNFLLKNWTLNKKRCNVFLFSSSWVLNLLPRYKVISWSKVFSSRKSQISDKLRTERQTSNNDLIQLITNWSEVNEEEINQL